MDRNAPITVEQVANGYIVREDRQRHGFLRNEATLVTSPDDTHVFETFDSLSIFLRGHFEFTPAQSAKAIAANP